jgi:lysozyme family protein
MPEMKENTTLRDGPNGNKIGKVAHAGAAVTVLETKDGFSHIKLDNGDEGWVDSNSIDTAGTGPAPEAINKQQFANACVIQALINTVNPHYLVGVAQRRSGITGGSEGNRNGPFRLTPEEWKTVVPPFEERDIISPNQQVSGFALMTQQRMAVLGPTATPVQLYLAQFPDTDATTVEEKLKTAFDDTAIIEGKAEQDILDPPALDAGKKGPAVQNLIAANQQRWQDMKINTSTTTIDVVARRLVALAAKSRYQAISATTGVPWFIIAVIHEREKSNDVNFLANIAQGDLWNKVSVNVPAGRGPFASFEEAAVDALTNCAPHAARWGDWSIGGALTLLEHYNGLGYAVRGLPSPYIWASTDQYVKGKFIKDHVFDPNKIDSQLGCAAMLARMKEADHSITIG